MSDATTGNLLTLLHRWAWRQDENFITDAFAHLLRRLVEYDPPAGLQILSRLTNERFSVEWGTQGVTIRTQVTAALGRPDIEIRSPRHLVYVEAKIESGLGYRQLERYLEQQQNELLPIGSTLVILSRYPVDIPESIRPKVIAQRWYEVAHWLDLLLGQGLVSDPVNKFLVEQFLGFLQGRNITMEKVGPELIPGVRAFRSLISMAAEVIASHGLSTASTFGREWAGYNFYKAKQEYFLGMYYEQPQSLVFQTNFAVSPEAVTEIGTGKVINRQWRNELPLDDEAEPFFSLDRGQQLDRIAQFLERSLELAQKVRVPTQLSPEPPLAT